MDPVGKLPAGKGKGKLVGVEGVEASSLAPSVNSGNAEPDNNSNSTPSEGFAEPNDGDKTVLIVRMCARNFRSTYAQREYFRVSASGSDSSLTTNTLNVDGSSSVCDEGFGMSETRNYVMIQTRHAPRKWLKFSASRIS